MLRKDQRADLIGLLYPSFFEICPDGYPPQMLDDLLKSLPEEGLDEYQEVLEIALADPAFDFSAALPKTPRSSDELRTYAEKTLAQIKQWRATGAA